MFPLGAGQRLPVEWLQDLLPLKVRTVFIIVVIVVMVVEEK
jgi:hypothetical protein